MSITVEFRVAVVIAEIWGCKLANYTLGERRGPNGMACKMLKGGLGKNEDVNLGHISSINLLFVLANSG